MRGKKKRKNPNLQQIMRKQCILVELWEKCICIHCLKGRTLSSLISEAFGKCACKITFSHLQSHLRSPEFSRYMHSLKYNFLLRNSSLLVFSETSLIFLKKSIFSEGIMFLL